MPARCFEFFPWAQGEIPRAPRPPRPGFVVNHHNGKSRAFPQIEKPAGKLKRPGSAFIFLPGLSTCLIRAAPFLSFQCMPSRCSPPSETPLAPMPPASFPRPPRSKTSPPVCFFLPRPPRSQRSGRERTLVSHRAQGNGSLTSTHESRAPPPHGLAAGSPPGQKIAAPKFSGQPKKIVQVPRWAPNTWSRPRAEEIGSRPPSGKILLPAFPGATSSPRLRRARRRKSPRGNAQFRAQAPPSMVGACGQGQKVEGRGNPPVSPHWDPYPADSQPRRPDTSLPPASPPNGDPLPTAFAGTMANRPISREARGVGKARAFGPHFPH